MATIQIKNWIFLWLVAALMLLLKMQKIQTTCSLMALSRQQSKHKDYSLNLLTKKQIKTFLLICLVLTKQIISLDYFFKTRTITHSFLQIHHFKLKTKKHQLSRFLLYFLFLVRQQPIKLLLLLLQPIFSKIKLH